MNWWFALPTYLSLVFAFLFGIGAGSFINVLVARLPYEKSVFWPASTCFSCFHSIRWWQNVPLLGYLMLRGRCRQCGARFSSRYFWVEFFTGVIFTLLYFVDVASHSYGGPWKFPAFHQMPGLEHPFYFVNDWTPMIKGLALWATHAVLMTLLIAASLIDAEHRIIPTTITYPGTIIGLIASMLMPWPWPSDSSAVPVIAGAANWILPQYEGKIPDGLQLWPAIGPPPAWAPAGSWLLGLLNGLMGAAAGMIVGRSIKFVYEKARGIEALGLGDADLLMMIGAFWGWQVAVLAFPMGALFSIVMIVIPQVIYRLIARKPIDPALPFGPGIAMGAVFIWLAWSRLKEPLRMTFDPITLAVALGIPVVGLFVCGLILRRRTS
ncbi:MAG: prepilin peptidase [Gemmataceae bacterium]